MRTHKRVRYAVVGLGNLAQVAVLPAFRHAAANSELGALISGDAEKLRVLGRGYDVVHLGSYEQLEFMLAEAQIDAMYLVTPNSTHRELVERALAAGVHVLCEKPMAMTVADCEAMNAAVRKYHRKLMVANRLHFEEATVKALNLAHSGELGDLRYFSSVFSHQVRMGNIRTKRSAGGGALFDLGPCPINIVRQLFRAEPLEVFAWQAHGIDARSREVDEMTTAIMRFSDDRRAQFTVSQGAAAVNEYRIVGTKGSLMVDPGFDYTEGLTHHTVINERKKDHAFAERDQFAPEIIAFSDCILKDREPETSGDEGLRDVRVFEAIQESADLGKPIRLAPMAPGGSTVRRKESIRRAPVEPVETILTPSTAR